MKEKRKKESLGKTIRKQYGKYEVTIQFSEQDIQDAGKLLLSMIMQAYIQRLEKNYEV